jgi:hypothetical protein
VLVVTLDTVVLELDDDDELDDVVLDTIVMVTDEGGTAVDLIVTPLDGGTLRVVEGGDVAVLMLAKNHYLTTF